MKFDRPHLSLEQQVDLLIRRGMLGDRRLMLERLGSVGYFRLKGYTYPFREVDPSNPERRLDTFRPSTRFEDVWARYAFDRRLRLLVMDAIERIEIAVRSRLAEEHGVRNGVFGYCQNPKSLPGCRGQAWHDLIDRHRREQDRSRDQFAEWYKNKYSERDMPIWMATEVWSLGTLLAFFTASGKDVRAEVSKIFEVDESVLSSWLLSLNTVRNICAHHARLWNRELGTHPRIPNKRPEWNSPQRVPGKRIFPVLTICRWSLARIAPQSSWNQRCSELIDRAAEIPLVSMGFPAWWRECPIWQNPQTSLPAVTGVSASG
jgi:abortive infection bacteriophage resistance protein